MLMIIYNSKKEWQFKNKFKKIFNKLVFLIFNLTKQVSLLFLLHIEELKYII